MDIIIRNYIEEDFETIQKLYQQEGWLTVVKREQDAIEAFKNSQIALVATLNNQIIGFLRALTDTQITTYIAELLVDSKYRKNGIANQLLEYCHNLYPNTRLDVLASDESIKFYLNQHFKEQHGFRKSYI